MYNVKLSGSTTQNHCEGEKFGSNVEKVVPV